jgi:hypothetical protein
MFSDYCYLSQRAFKDLLRFVLPLLAAKKCKAPLQRQYKMLTLFTDKMQLLHQRKLPAATYNTNNNKHLQMLNQGIT